MKYDYLIVGSGLYGAMFAHMAKRQGKKCLVIDKRPQKGGNLFCENIEGIQVHKYGPHIFHTSNKIVWDFVNSLVPFNHFRYCPLACYHGRFYHLPFNMNTFYEMWGAKTPMEAHAIIDKQRQEIKTEPANLEEQAISLVGREIYETLVKGYTEKQWGRDCRDLPSFIIKRLPLRFYFDNNYFNDCYQGIPIGGYNILIERLLDGIEVRLNINYIKNRYELNQLADKIVYTGAIDEFYDYKLGPLEYRSLRFEEKIIDQESCQGNAAVNYTDIDHPYTRIVEHKYFEFGRQPKTVITIEYPEKWEPGKERFYPINDSANNLRYEQYKALGQCEQKVIFGGRLAEYHYYDMAPIIEKIMKSFKFE